MLFSAVGFILLEVNRKQPISENLNFDFSPDESSINNSNAAVSKEETAIEKADRLDLEITQKFEDLRESLYNKEISISEFEFQRDQLFAPLEIAIREAIKERVRLGEVYSFEYRSKHHSSMNQSNARFLPDELEKMYLYEDNYRGFKFRYPSEVVWSDGSAVQKIGLEGWALRKDSSIGHDAYVVSVNTIRDYFSESPHSPFYSIVAYKDPTLTIDKVLQEERVMAEAETEFRGIKFRKVAIDAGKAIDHSVFTVINGHLIRIGTFFMHDNLPLEILFKSLEIY